MRAKLVALAVVAGLRACGAAAQENPPPPTPAAPAPTAAETEPKKEPAVYRPIEGPIIINLPSVDVPQKGTLTLFFTHRFSQPVQDSDFNTLFSFDSPANIGIGLGYAPLKNLNISFYRYSNSLTDYQFDGKYAVLSGGPFALSLAAGGDVRSASGLDHRSTFFAQAILAGTIASRIRITAVPTYLNRTSGQSPWFFDADVNGTPTTFRVEPEPVYKKVFNVPVAASIALTPSINIHGEVVPSYRRTVLMSQTFPECDPGACPVVAAKSSPGVGWTVSLEKVLLRHRFAFTAGNMRETTVDQYVLPNFVLGFQPPAPGNVYLGFNITRQWKLN